MDWSPNKPRCIPEQYCYSCGYLFDHRLRRCECQKVLGRRCQHSTSVRDPGLFGLVSDIILHLSCVLLTKRVIQVVLIWKIKSVHEAYFIIQPSWNKNCHFYPLPGGNTLKFSPWRKINEWELICSTALGTTRLKIDPREAETTLGPIERGHFRYPWI